MKKKAISILAILFITVLSCTPFNYVSADSETPVIPDIQKANRTSSHGEGGW
ncbi:hypothetical protein SAMN06272722_11081 [Paenibacillus sp. RU5A]|nr:hypothetical protein SAMN03159332_6316 [Paenibacillus sp. 276b]SLK16137.1 hypothetical protein SAMN06272722_11081 [Paenibacillus sp. RU5A]SOC74218.1 hypothetical protein SAMN05880581_11081 [Paenibacillus sp. RU26A]SOC76368.1 hypothetical protein SAMN05880586_11081 [Paenibacillus sp. RU5M]